MGLFGDGAARRARREARRKEKQAFRLEKMGIRSDRQEQRQGFFKEALPTLVPGVKDLLGGLAGAPGPTGDGGIVPAAPPKDPMKSAIPLLLGLVVLGTLLKKKKGFS